MRSISTNSAMAFLLIFSLLHLQIGSARAGRKLNDKSRAVFLGIQFENVPQDIQETLTFRLTEILEFQKQFTLIIPEAAHREYGYGAIVNLLSSQNKDAIISFAKKNRLDFVYSGVLANNSSNDRNIVLSGELNRYDAASGEVHQHRIHTAYSDIGNELLNFSDLYVQNLPAQKSKSNILGSLILGGLVLIGVLAISLALGGSGGGEGEEEIPFPVDE
ncbi:MAG: hypothetical protein ACE5I1_13175 [bacterium]